MRIFVTGGTGFIGKALVRELKARKYAVSLLKGRLDKVPDIVRQLRRFKPDVAIHLAWEGIPDLGRVMSARNRVQGLRFLKAAAEVRVPKVIGTGSSYQRPHVDPGDHRFFIAAKNTVRDQGGAQVRKAGGTFIWTYPYFVYGPGKPGRSLIPSLIADARAGHPPRAKNPDMWHDFVHVDDVARALVLLAEKEIPSGAFDIGSGKLTRTGDIANMVARAFSLPTVNLTKRRARGVAARTRALMRATGWRPRVALAAGIRSMTPQ